MLHNICVITVTKFSIACTSIHLNLVFKGIKILIKTSLFFCQAFVNPEDLHTTPGARIRLNDEDVERVRRYEQRRIFLNKAYLLTVSTFF